MSMMQSLRRLSLSAQERSSRPFAQRVACVVGPLLHQTMPSTRSASRHKAGKATSALLDGGRLACVAEFLTLKDFCSLAVTSRGRLAAVEDPSTLTALATVYPVLRAKAVRARVAASGRELVELAHATDVLKYQLKFEDKEAGFECVVDIALPDGKRIVQCGPLEYYDVDGDHDICRLMVLLRVTGENRDVIALKTEKNYSDAALDDPCYAANTVSEDWEIIQNGSPEAKAELAAVYELFAHGGGIAKITLVREKDGKVLQLYDGAIGLARNDWHDNWEPPERLNTKFEIPLDFQRSGTITPMGFLNNFMIGAELQVVSSCEPLASGGYGYTPDKVMLMFENFKVPKRYGLFDRYPPVEISSLEHLHDLLDYCGDWR